jgi:predicted Rossmann fold flavoprotein
MDADVIVVGAGAAGMMAALTAAQAGARVVLLEKNGSIGRKLAITGKGRCNLTNRTDINELVANIPGNGRFLYSVFQRFGPEELMAFFEEQLKVPLKVERGRRVFPESDRAMDIIEGLDRCLQNSGVELVTKARVTGLVLDQEKKVAGVICENSWRMGAGAVVLGTGGASYPATGSTGDGYRLAEAVGHRIVPVRPSLVPLETREDWPKRLEGLSLTNVEVTSYHRGKKLQSEFGEMLFTSFGLSGPLILSLSREIAPLVLAEPDSVTIGIDLKPALTEEELDLRVQRDFNEFVRKLYKNALDELLPQKLIPVIIDLSGIDPVKPVHQITREERLKLVNLLKNFRLTVSRPRPIAEAIVTAGGIGVKEINPKTLESKVVPGLFLAGEVVDVDGYTGGYNLQIAFSMGNVAGREAAGKCKSLK